MTKPILDPVYQGKPHDYSYSRIQMLKGAPEIAPFPAEYKNPYAKQLAPRDQQDRGTCVGQATAYCYDLMYMMLMKDVPTPEDKACYKKNVVDVLETTHDVLYPQSASAESFYQESRKIGNVTYPSGSEVRFSARAWCGYGMNLETQWHTDKTGYKVWTLPPGVREVANGGMTPEQATEFASQHKAEGWAQVSTTPGGNPTWEQVCSAIANKGFCLGAIPIYENFSSMEGGDGAYPDPGGALSGFHALCFYGYDENNLYLMQSWGNWCGIYGSLSYNYFRHAIDLIQFFVILDANEVLIAREGHSSISVTSNVPAQLTVNGVLVGNTPQKIALEKGKMYSFVVSADGYIAQSKTVDESMTVWNVTLEPLPVPKKNWFEKLIDWLKSLFRRN